MSTMHLSALVLVELVKDRMIDALQVGYDATRREVETPSFNLIGEDIVDII